MSRVAAIAAHAPEVGVVCAFGQLIKEPLLTELPMLNLHPSLLPRWRGAAPIERSIMAGDERTGACVMRLTEGLDSGPVALREEIAIAPGDDYGTLAGRLAELGGGMLVEALDALGRRRPRVRRADRGGGHLRREDRLRRAPGRPRPSRRREALRVRALSPHIGAFVALADGDRLGLRAVEALPDGPPAGTFAELEGRLLLGCSRGALAVGELQPSGGRWMAAADYLRGRGLPAPLPSV